LATDGSRAVNAEREAKGNVTEWTQTGRSYRSRPRDCRAARVFYPRLPSFCWWFRIGRTSENQAGAEKPLEWYREQPGSDASIIYESSYPSRCRNPSGKAKKIHWCLCTSTREPGDLPPVPGISPTLGRNPRRQHGGCRGDSYFFEGNPAPCRHWLCDRLPSAGRCRSARVHSFDFGAGM